MPEQVEDDRPKGEVTVAFRVVDVGLAGGPIRVGQPPYPPTRSRRRRVSGTCATSYTWTQANASERTYELRSGNDVVAIPRWQKAGGSLALGESAEGKWSFKRTGFFSPKITVRAAGTESDIAIFTPDWFAGKGKPWKLAGGGKYRWVTTSSWRSQMAFCNEAGQPPVLIANPSWAGISCC